MYAQTPGTITETPVPATPAEPSATDYKAAASALAEHGLGEGTIPAPATEEDGRPIVYQFDTTALDFVASDGRRFNTVQEAETYSADANA
ncbi:gp72 [Rhodococcus phage ReqiPine5]|uniref:Gp72 n=1 Tax=Rhodococcus phage ReqiPine5 TaxID=691963 RepID=D4P847_9CAUD|nr:gp72 [Rhodococcus phage ReqiPine5]ADD81177.1 gp72 [Rhodococcus phage ReqiPine5]